MNSSAEIRPSPIAGLWYSGDPKLLREEIEAYLQAAELPELDGQVVGIMAPHAGHRYSGSVAAYAFRSVQGLHFDLVAVVSPMHQPYPQHLLTCGHRAYQTPLGTIPIEQEAVAQVDSALRAELGFGLSGVLNDQEHSLEIELPFLQCALGGEFKLLPVMVRDQSPQVAQKLGKALADSLRGRRALLVASTDLSHFYPENSAEELDKETLRQVEAFSPEGLYSVEEEGRGYACGLGALAAVLWAARGLGADRVQVLQHATSGNVTGDFSSVVGYGSAVILKTQ